MQATLSHTTFYRPLETTWPKKKLQRSQNWSSWKVRTSIWPWLYSGTVSSKFQRLSLHSTAALSLYLYCTISTHCKYIVPSMSWDKFHFKYLFRISFPILYSSSYFSLFISICCILFFSLFSPFFLCSVAQQECNSFPPRRKNKEKKTGLQLWELIRSLHNVLLLCMRNYTIQRISLFWHVKLLLKFVFPFSLLVASFYWRFW